MDIKNFLKPNFPKILILLFSSFIFLYFAKESVCGAGFLFGFCYNSYGFPFEYLVIGDPSSIGYVRTLPLGQFFYKAGNALFNPAAMMADVLLIYLLACMFYAVFTIKGKKYHAE